MARVDKKRHSGTTRKPAAIDHEPLNQSSLRDQPQKKPDAEPVALTYKTTEQKAASHSIHKNEPDKSSHISKNSDATVKIAKTDEMSSSNTKKHDLNDKDNMSTQKKFFYSKNSLQNICKNNINGLLTGVAGGIIALILAGTLQYSGIITPGYDNNQTIMTGDEKDKAAVKSIQQEMSALKEEISALKQQNQHTAIDNSTNVIDKNIIAETTKIAKNAHIAADQVQQSFKKLIQETAQFKSDLNELKADITAIKKEEAIQNNTLSVRADDPLIQSLHQKTDNLDQRLIKMQDIVETVQQLKNLVAENTNNIEHNSKILNNIAIEIKNMPDPMTERKQAMTVLIAANALKSAVDRGGSYDNQLTLFEGIAPDGISLDELKQYSNSGIASHTNLVEQFNSVADAIASTENQVDANANWSAKIWSTAKSFISIRPTGNIEGTNPAAIAARMEIAIKQGDYTRALSEWQTLPKPAQEVSIKFIEQLKARNNINNLVEKLINITLHPDDKAAPKTSTHVDTIKEMQP